METHPLAKKGSRSLPHPSPPAGRWALCKPPPMPSSLLLQQSVPAIQGGRTGSGRSLQLHVAVQPTAKETLGVSQQKWNSNLEPDLTWYILIDCHMIGHLFIIWVSFLCMRNAFVQGGTHAPLNFYMEKNIFYLFIALLSSFQQAFGKSLDPDL